MTNTRGSRAISERSASRRASCIRSSRVSPDVAATLAIAHLYRCIDRSKIDCLLRQWCGFGTRGHGRKVRVHVIGHFLKFHFGQIALSDQLFFQPLDRTLLLPRFDFLLGTVGRSSITAKMTVPAISYAFKERRTAAAACFRRGLLHRLVHGFDIVA